MLRFAISTVTACAFAGALSVFAQEPQAPQEQKEQPPPAASATLTGCVQEAKTTDGGKAYVLNKVEGGTDTMYVLVGPPESELASHVSHKVEVTGQVQQPSPPAAEEEAQRETKVLRPPLVQVESVKMVAQNCN